MADKEQLLRQDTIHQVMLDTFIQQGISPETAEIYWQDRLQDYKRRHSDRRSERTRNLQLYEDAQQMFTLLYLAPNYVSDFRIDQAELFVSLANSSNVNLADGDIVNPVDLAKDFRRFVLAATGKEVNPNITVTGIGERMRRRLHEATLVLQTK